MQRHRSRKEAGAGRYYASGYRRGLVSRRSLASTDDGWSGRAVSFVFEDSFIAGPFPKCIGRVRSYAKTLKLGSVPVFGVRKRAISERSPNPLVCRRTGAEPEQDGGKVNSSLAICADRSTIPLNLSALIVHLSHTDSRGLQKSASLPSPQPVVPGSPCLRRRRRR